ncbi:MAG: hypothetical protein AAF571_03665 [Verrucomicrobiota bacterium]
MGFATNKLLACLVLVMGIAGMMALHAQETPDVLYLKSGEVIEGKVIGTLPNGAVNFKFSQGTLPYPRNTIQKIELAERPELAKAQDAAAAGDNEQVIQILTPLVDKFLGFQSPWVGQAAGELASALAETGKTFKAVELAKEISRLYPDLPIGTILEANILLTQDKTDEALIKLNSIKESLPVKTTPNVREMQLLGSYHFSLARALEQQQKHAQALENYFIVSAVYPHPKKRANQAQKKADALLAAHSGLMVP